MTGIIRSKIKGISRSPGGTTGTGGNQGWTGPTRTGSPGGQSSNFQQQVRSGSSVSTSAVQYQCYDTMTDALKHLEPWKWCGFGENGLFGNPPGHGILNDLKSKLP